MEVQLENDSGAFHVEIREGLVFAELRHEGEEMATQVAAERLENVLVSVCGGGLGLERVEVFGQSAMEFLDF